MSTKLLMFLVVVATLAAAYFIEGYDFTDPNYQEYVRRRAAGIVDEVDKPETKTAATPGHHPTKLVNTVGPDGQIISQAVQASDVSDPSTQPAETFRSKFFSEGQPMEAIFVYAPDPSEVDPAGPKGATIIMHEDGTFVERVTPINQIAAVERSGKYRLYDNTLALTYSDGPEGQRKVSRWIYPIGAEDLYGRPPKMAIDGRIYRLEKD